MAITITTGHRLFQREIFNGVTSQGTVTIAGTYDGSPTSITISIRKVADDAEINFAFQPDPAGGTYSIEVESIPESVLANASTDLYYAHVTAVGTGDTASSKGTYEFHVGRTALQLGQSNGNGMNTATIGADTPPDSLPGTYFYDGTFGWEAVPVIPNASGVRNFLNELVTRTGVPWVFTLTNTPGTNLDWFDPVGPGTGYTTASNRISTLGDVELLLWNGGESAAVGGTARNTYPTAYATLLDSIHGSLATLAGRTKAQLPMFLQGLGREIEGGADYGAIAWHRAQQCLRHSAITLANVHYSHANIDAPLGDNIHWNGLGQQNHARRLALTIAKHYGIETKNCFWEVTAASVTNNTVTRITLSTGDTLAGDFAPSSGITGFEVSSDGVTWVSCTGAKVNATTIDLTHTSLPYPNRCIRFAFGDTPDITALPRETLYDAPPATSHVWVVDEQDAEANPILKMEEQYQFDGNSPNSVTAMGPTANFGNPIAYGNGILYIVTGHNGAFGQTGITCNGNAMESVFTDYNANNCGSIWRLANNTNASTLVMQFDSNPFASPIARCFYLLAGTLEPLSLVSNRATAVSMSVAGLSIEDDGLLFRVGGPSDTTQLSGPFAPQWEGGGASGDNSFAQTYANETSASATITWDSGGSSDKRMAIASFGSPTIVSQDAGVWTDIPGATSTTLVTNIPGQYRYVADGHGGEVISNVATVSNS